MHSLEPRHIPNKLIGMRDRVRAAAAAAGAPPFQHIIEKVSDFILRVR